MNKPLRFQSKIERIAKDMEYYALAVPAKITKTLGTTKAVPVFARVNGSKPFLNSLYPVGGGKHYLRVKAVVRNEVGFKEGDKVKVEITVRDRSKEVSIPKDVVSALKSEGVLKHFQTIPPGQRSFMLRKIEEAAKPETRKKRIQEAVESAHKRREKGLK